MVHLQPWFVANCGTKTSCSKNVHWPTYEGMYYTPIVGFYNSSDYNTINWQLSLMEKAGIDGLIVDWEGPYDNNAHANEVTTTNRIWSTMRDSYHGLKMGICLDNADITYNESAFIEDMNFLKDNFFGHEQYLKYSDGNPILLTFSSGDKWKTITPKYVQSVLDKTGTSNTYVFNQWKATPEKFNFTDNPYDNFGVYDWVWPQNKASSESTQKQQCLTDQTNYFNEAKSSKFKSKFYMGAIYHGFSDHYNGKTTGTTNPYNHIGFINEDYEYLDYLYNNMKSKNYDPYVVQIPDWNDYTEGTNIEPSIPTSGCTKGCGDNTASNPYNDLVTIYKLFVDANVDTNTLIQEFKDITNKYFPNTHV